MLIHIELPTVSVTKPQEFFHPIWPLIGSKLWVAGGSVNRWLEGREKNSADFDLFSPDPEHLHLKLKEVTGDFVRESFLAYTYKWLGRKVQLIKRKYETLEEVLLSFDFTARMAGLDGEHLVVHPDTRNDIIYRTIRFHKGDFSITTTSLYGLVKYGNRGYTLDHEQARLFMKSWKVPEENLTLGYVGGIR